MGQGSLKENYTLTTLMEQLYMILASYKAISVCLIPKCMRSYGINTI